MSPERIGGEEYTFKSDIWSFGLSIMTIALGKFPYDSKSGYWELLHSIKELPVPELPKQKFSREFRDFLSKAMQKDQYDRPSAKELLKHPFIINRIQEPVEKSQDVECKTTPESIKVELYEITRHLTQYYTGLAEKRIEQDSWSFKEIVSWLEKSPTWQTRNIYGLAEQIGADPTDVHTAFETCLNSMLEQLKF